MTNKGSDGELYYFPINDIERISASFTYFPKGKYILGQKSTNYYVYTYKSDIIYDKDPLNQIKKDSRLILVGIEIYENGIRTTTEGYINVLSPNA